MIVVFNLPESLLDRLQILIVDAVDEEDTVEMVVFVQDDAGVDPFDLFSHAAPIQPGRFDSDFEGPLDGEIELRDREARLLFYGRLFRVAHNFWVDVDNRFAHRPCPIGKVDIAAQDKKTVEITNLVCGEANAVKLRERLDHRDGYLFDLIGDLCDRFGPFAQNRIAIVPKRELFQGWISSI